MPFTLYNVVTDQENSNSHSKGQDVQFDPTLFTNCSLAATSNNWISSKYSTISRVSQQLMASNLHFTTKLPVADANEYLRPKPTKDLFKKSSNLQN